MNQVQGCLRRTLCWSFPLSCLHKYFSCLSGLILEDSNTGNQADAVDAPVSRFFAAVVYAFLRPLGLACHHFVWHDSVRRLECFYAAPGSAIHAGASTFSIGGLRPNAW